MERPGSIVVRQSVRLPGGVASWTRGEGRVVDADEGQRVRIVTCATKSCTPSDAVTLRIIDFGSDAPARSVRSLRLTDHDGVPTTRFVDGLLYVAETPKRGSDSTTLHVVSTDDGPSADPPRRERGPASRSAGQSVRSFWTDTS
jgi:hypothetical protein